MLCRLQSQFLSDHVNSLRSIAARNNVSGVVSSWFIAEFRIRRLPVFIKWFVSEDEQNWICFVRRGVQIIVVHFRSRSDSDNVILVWSLTVYPECLTYPLTSLHFGYDEPSHEGGWHRTNGRCNLPEWKISLISLSSFPTKSCHKAGMNCTLRHHFSYGSAIDCAISATEIYVNCRNISGCCGYAWLRYHSIFHSYIVPV
jgi:hypothetical protein